MKKVLVDGTTLIKPIVQDLESPGMTPVLAIERALEAHLRQCFMESFSDILIKPPAVRFHSSYFKQRFASLPTLLSVGYDTWYPEITIATKPEDSFEDVSFASSGIELLPIMYGGGVSRVFRLKVKKLKRQINHTITINHIRLGTDFIQAIQNALSHATLLQPLIANFGPEVVSWWHRAVTFDHMLTGERFLCSCSMPYHNDAIMRPHFEHIGIGDLRKCLVGFKYSENLCHLCISRKASDDERYGASIETNYNAYVAQVMFDLGVDERTARAEIMHVLGLSRWKRESALYGLIREIFPDNLVLREASPDWLGRMRIDIYLPELGLAIEHQGEQHYKPLPVFGGEEAHHRVVMRDELKRRMCLENGVAVIDFKYDAALTKTAVKHRLRRYLEP